MIIELVDDKVTALHHADFVRIVAAHHGAEYLAHPGAGGIDERPGAHCFHAAIFRLDGHLPMVADAARRGAFGAGTDDRAPFLCPARVEDHEAGILHPAVGILVAADILLLQRLARYVGAQVHAARAGQDLASAQMIVEEQAHPQDGPGTQAVMVGQHETQRPDDVRRRLEQHLALDQRLAHQAELIMLEIAKPAMDELRGRTRRARGEVSLLGEKHLEAAPRCVPRNAAAIDAAADDEEVIDHSAASIALSFTAVPWAISSLTPLSLQ